MDKYYIRKDAFEKLFTLLSSMENVYCKDKEKTRIFLEAVYFIMRTGAQWGSLPRHYGKYKSVHRRFISWAKRGIWEKIFSNFSQDIDSESFMIDGTVVRAHACAAGLKKKQSGRTSPWPKQRGIFNKNSCCC